MANLEKLIIKTAVELCIDWDFVPNVEDYIEEEGNIDILTLKACEKYCGFNQEELYRECAVRYLQEI